MRIEITIQSHGLAAVADALLVHLLLRHREHCQRQLCCNMLADGRGMYAALECCYVDFMTINLDEHISQRSPEISSTSPIGKMNERSGRW
jgi:hypothetical protein